MTEVIDAAATFRQRLDSVAADTEALLGELLGDTPLAEERARPQRLMDAMRHVALGGANGCARSSWSRPAPCSAPRAQSPDGGRRARMRALLFARA